MNGFVKMCQDTNMHLKPQSTNIIEQRYIHTFTLESLKKNPITTGVILRIFITSHL